MISAIRGVCCSPCRRLFAWAQILVIWCGLCYDIAGAKNEMESRGDTPQIRRTSSGLSNSSVGMAGTDRTRNCAGERSRIGIGVLHPFRQPSQTSGDFPKEPLDTRDTRAASDGLAPQTKPRAALKQAFSSSNLVSSHACTTNKAACGIETFEILSVGYPIIALHHKQSRVRH